MMGKDLLIINLIEMKKQFLGGEDKVWVYLFGSYVKKNKVDSDVDMIILYDDSSVGVTDIITLRKKFAEQVRNKFDVVLDIVILTIRENKETNFIKRTKAQKIL